MPKTEIDTPEVGELPRSHRTRWVPARKAQVVRAVQAGLLTLDDARKKYRLSLAEFQSWQRSYAAGGLKGLRASTLFDHRMQRLAEG